jgi:hypothetical protein
LENGPWNRLHLLSVCEDGILLTLQLADLASVVPQLPSEEQPFFLSKQQELVTSLVSLLNVVVGANVFTALLQLAKGRLLLGRCLQTLPLQQRHALLLVCLGAAEQLAALPADEKVLRTAVLQVCNHCMGDPGVGAIHALAQAFASPEAFTAFVGTSLGAALMAALLGGLRRGPPIQPQVWEPVLRGLLDCLVPVLPQLCASPPEHPVYAMLLHLLWMSGPVHGLLLSGAMRGPVGEAKSRFGDDVPPNVVLLAEKLEI